MLMYGSAKNSRWLILPWLVATFLFILAYVAGMILSTHLFGVTLLSIAFLTIAIIEVGTLIIIFKCILNIVITVLYRLLPLALHHLQVPGARRADWAH